MSSVISDNAVISVVDPTADKVGAIATPLAARLETLNGKVLGLLSNSKPNAEIALQAVAEKIKETYPEVEIRLYHGSIRFEPSLLRRAIEESDALIGATADCGACTSWLIHDGAQAEKGGVPQVTIVARGFEHDTVSSSKVFGVPDLRYVVVPRVFTALTAEAAIDQALPAVPEIIRLLTVGGEDAELVEATAEVDDTDKEETYTFSGLNAVEAIDAFNTYFLEHDFSDGYPVHPPTPERVDEIVKALGLPADELILTVPPAHGHGTVAKIAASAAMAGCKPEEVPVVIAALKAIAACPPPMNLSTLMSTGAFAPVLLVGGPIAARLGINSGRCPLGPGQNNVVGLRIGRAVGLALRNLGLWIPGKMDLDTIGTVRKFIQVFGENTEESPWEPYQVTEGFRTEDSTVTVFHTTGEWDLGSNHGDADVSIRGLAARTPTALQVGYMTTTLGGLDKEQDGLVYLLPPESAKRFAAAGLSKTAVQRFLLHNIRPRISDVVAPFIDFRARGLIKPEWEWLFQLTPQEQRAQTIQAFLDPESIKIVVAGHGTTKDFVFGTMTAKITEKVTPLAARH
jgi:hypothetical protein